MSQAELAVKALALKRAGEGSQLARVLAERLDSDTLAAVLEQLLGNECVTAPERPHFRARDFREFLRIGRSSGTLCAPTVGFLLEQS
jgi:hypothetical protein